jgi:archaellin
MKKAIVGIAILIAAVIAYVAVGPFITLRQIKSALQSQDTERLSENIDFPTLRQNLKEQLSAFIVKETARALSLPGAEPGRV